jgi:hypothetical protein
MTCALPPAHKSNGSWHGCERDIERTGHFRRAVATHIHSAFEFLCGEFRKRSREPHVSWNYPGEGAFCATLCFNGELPSDFGMLAPHRRAAHVPTGHEPA